MIIHRKSKLTGAQHSRDINVTPDQITDWLSGTLIQDAMPDISADDREFIMNGITPEEWGKTFGDE